MGDRKLSQFFRHFEILAKDVHDHFLRTIWAIRLPPLLQGIIAGQTECSLDSASNLADRICEIAPQSNTASVFPAMPHNTTGLLEQIEDLSRQVASLRASQTYSHSRPQTTATRSQETAARKPETASATLTPLRHPTTPASTPRISGTQPVIPDRRAPASREMTLAEVNGG
jgi:hypothetical protein